MPSAIEDFWKLAVASGLLTPARCRQLHAEFASRQKEGQPRGTRALAQWLVANRTLSRDQALALLAGRRADPAAPAAPAPAAAALPLPQATASGEPPWEPPAGSLVSVPRRRGRQSISPLALGGGIAALVLIGGLVTAGWMRTSAPQQQGATATSAPTANSNDLPPDQFIPAGPSDAVESDEQARSNTPAAATSSSVEIDDDGKTLWASPTAGEPLVLDYLPPGGQVFLVVRFAELLANPEGAKALEALGRGAQSLMRELPAIVGVDAAQIEQLTVAFIPAEAERPQTALVARLRDALPVDPPPGAWGAVRRKEHNAQSYFEGAHWGWYLPGSGQGRIVVVAPPAMLPEVLDAGGPPPLRKGMESLLRTSDQARHVNLLVAPSYLFTDGKSLLAGELARLGDPMARTFGESCEALLLSAHVGSELFMELRAVGPVEVPPQKLADKLTARLAEAADEVEHYVASQDAPPYGRLVLHRYPRMVQLVKDYTRAAVEDRQAVLRCYLPLAAAHNLVLGTQLALVTNGPPGERRAAPAPAAPSVETAGSLAKTVSLSFPRETLERSMELLAKEIDTEIVILGADLQLDGIAKNQSFGIDLRDRPADEILREVLKLANPDGKLVYVVRPKAGGGEAVYITTRAAAAKRGEKLPATLTAPSPPKKS